MFFAKLQFTAKSFLRVKIISCLFSCLFFKMILFSTFFDDLSHNAEPLKPLYLLTYTDFRDLPGRSAKALFISSILIAASNKFKPFVNLQISRRVYYLERLCIYCNKKFSFRCHYLSLSLLNCQTLSTLEGRIIF